MNGANQNFTLLRAEAAKHPHAQLTEWHNYNFNTKVKARSPESTFLSDRGINSWLPHIDAGLAALIERKQHEHLSRSGSFLISGSIGNENFASMNANFIIEKAFPNIAAMQDQLLFPSNSNDTDIQVIYTPNLLIEEFDNGRGIIIDLDNMVTRIFGTDYFGESKKAGLRLWNKWIFEKGGLALHAGCKSYRNKDGMQRSMLIIGLSGTGKTTTTFTPHAFSQPLQDDFCAFFQNGRIYASENGCFAKTYGLDPQHEPIIFQGLTDPQSWLENVYVGANGRVDYYNDSITTNGRGTFPLDLIPHGDLNSIPRMDKILILNKDFNIIPAIAKLNPRQAAAYFMLGETMGTSAGGSAEAGKALRVPGTNPFFPLDHAMQGNRFMDLLEQSPDIDVYLLNTGHIGQNDSREGGEKISIAHSSVLIETMLNDDLLWVKDPDFGYQIVDDNASPIDSGLTNPRSYYAKQNNLSEYHRILGRVNKDRLDFFAQFPSLNPQISKSI